MLSKIILKLGKEANVLNYNSGSLFQGFLMENLDRDVARYLHTLSYNPYSQYISKTEEGVEWIVSGIDEFAYKNIIERIENIGEINLDSKNLLLIVKEVRKSVVKREDFISEIMFGKENDRTKNLRIITPISFKSQGYYQNMPSVKLIYQNLLNKFDSTGSDKLYSEELLNELVNNSYINRYHIMSSKYSLEGVKIASFKGYLDISTKGSKELINISNLLLKFAEYSGIGIKTSIGMGGVTVGNREYSKR